MNKFNDKKLSPPNPSIKRFNKFLLQDEESETKQKFEHDSNISSLNTSETPINYIANTDENNNVNKMKKGVKKFEEILSNLNENDLQEDGEKIQNNKINDELINEILISKKDPVYILNELASMLKSPFDINIRTETNNNIQFFIAYIKVKENHIIEETSNSKSEAEYKVALKCLKYLITSKDQDYIETIKLILHQTKENPRKIEISNLNKTEKSEQSFSVSDKKTSDLNEITANVENANNFNSQIMKDEKQFLMKFLGEFAEKQKSCQIEANSIEDLEALQNLSEILNESLIWNISEEKRIKVDLYFAGHHQIITGSRKERLKLKIEAVKKILKKVHADKEIMYRVLERRKDSFKISKHKESNKSMEEMEKKSFLQNKLEECNILNSLSPIYHRKIDHRFFLEKNFKEDEEVLFSKVIWINEQNRSFINDFLELKKMFACINEDEKLTEKLKDIGLDILFPCGSFAIGCLRRNRMEYDLIAHYNKGENDDFIHNFFEIIKNDLSDIFDIKLKEKTKQSNGQNEFYIEVQNKQKSNYFLKIYSYALSTWMENSNNTKIQNFQRKNENNCNLYYSPTFYHFVWMYENMKHKKINDDFVALNRLVRIWREKNKYWDLKSEIIDCIIYKCSSNYSFIESDEYLMNYITNFFELIASGCLINKNTFIKTYYPHEILLSDISDELKTRITKETQTFLRDNDIFNLF